MAKICVISTPIFQLRPPNGLTGYGGLEIIAWECARGLAQRGHQVTLIAPEGSSCPGCNVVPNILAGFFFNPDPRVRQHYMQDQVAYGGDGKQGGWGGYWPVLLQHDAVIDHSWGKNAYMLKKEGRLKGPVLGVLHAPVDTMMRQPPPVDKPCVICISDDQKAHYEALFNRPNGARRCYNGIDLDFYKSVNVPRWDRFLFLGRYSPVKSPDVAIDAAKRAGVGLDLIGDTTITNDPDLFYRCMAMADGEQIKVVGGKTRSECVWWFSKAHCMLHPVNNFREPFGLAPVEAMACGCPVACWNNGAMRETVKHEETGWICNTMEEFYLAIRIANNGIADAMRKRCRSWASQFSLDAMCNSYTGLVQEALDGGW